MNSVAKPADLGGAVRLVREAATAWIDDYAPSMGAEPFAFNFYSCPPEERGLSCHGVYARQSLPIA